MWKDFSHSNVTGVWESHIKLSQNFVLMEHKSLFATDWIICSQLCWDFVVTFPTFLGRLCSDLSGVVIKKFEVKLMYYL